MKKNLLPLLLLLLTFTAAVPLGARTQYFRSGTVLAAEMSLQKPPFSFEEPLRYPADVDTVMYAAVVVMVDKGRALSIYDYVLEVVGKRFPCVAIRIDNAPVDMRLTDVRNPSAFSKYTLLFAADAELIGKTARETLKLIPAAGPETTASELTFELRGNRALTPPDAIPQKGILTVGQ